MNSFAKFLPRPLLSILLFVCWLLLNDSLAFGQMLLALLFALLIPLITEPLHTQHIPAPQPLKMGKYLLILILDIIVANIRVAKLILGAKSALKPGFCALPLDITGDLPITILASSVTLTPGTLSAEISEDQKWLYIHTLDLSNEDELINEIKTRYEQPLKEMFQC